MKTQITKAPQSQITPTTPIDFWVVFELLKLVRFTKLADDAGQARIAEEIAGPLNPDSTSTKKYYSMKGLLDLIESKIIYSTGKTAFKKLRKSLPTTEPFKTCFLSNP